MTGDLLPKRVAGFYWCQTLSGKWIVAQWARTGKRWGWLVPGVSTMFRTVDHFIEVDERRLMRQMRDSTDGA